MAIGDGGGPVGEADALVGRAGPVGLAVFTADCGAVAMASPEGVMAAVHAGWRGLVAGVIEAAAASMRSLGASRVEAALGPCIHPECYEFGPGDLEAVRRRLGPSVEGRTSDARPALDLPAAVAAACRLAGVDLVADAGTCTSCSDAYYSHRRSADPERQAVIVWTP